MAEICSYAAPPPDENVLHPSNSLTCKEGDPSCDFGPAGDGICTFKLSICFNVSDTRIPCVSTDMVTRIHFSNPNQAYPRTATDTDNRDALEAGLLTFPGGAISSVGQRSIVYTPALTTPDICTPGVLFKVPLRQTALGLKTKHTAMRYRVYQDATKRVTDGDILRMTCTP